MPEHMLIHARCAPFKIELPANPSTGFQWTLETYDTSRFDLVTSEYVAPATARIGAKGVRIFYFKPKEALVCPEVMIVNFVYARSWEKGLGMSTEVTVKFNKKE